MSSNPDGYSDITPHLSPYQSAQPQGSLFGGPSSQDVGQESYPVRKREGDDEEQYDLDALMRDQPLPLFDNDFSDDETYEGSDDEDGYDGVITRSADYETPKEDDIDGPPAIRRDHTSPSPSSSSSSTPYRANRFRGPVVTWRHLTAGDRLNAEALETARSWDLAAHLYNAFALRERARVAAESESGLDDAEFFLPPKHWTAWPLMASEVPRVDEHIRRQEDDGWTLRMQPDPRPSADLEEPIIAFILKTAKERFESREWVSKGSTGREGKEANALGIGADGDKKVKNDPDSLDETEFRPVVQADDDKSRRQLRPLTRNIITQLDRLLMALHDARKSVIVTADDSSASESESDAESVASKSSRGKAASKRRSGEERERSQSRGRKRARRSSHASTSRSRSKSKSASVGPAASRESSESRSTNSSRSREPSTGYRPGPYQARLGPRDWSQVIGVATLANLPQAVVQRASQRCASLFGEDMVFETLKEGRMERVQTEDGQKWAYVESESEEEEEEPARRPTRSGSRAASTQREPTTGAVSLGVEDEVAEPRLKGRGEHRKQDLVCPIRACPRHKDGFTRRWNLNQHMKRMHEGYQPRKPERLPPFGVSLE